MKILALIANVLVGTLFLASAYFKMYPVEFFEAKISTFGFGALTSSVAARLILGFELLLGACLVMQITFNGRIHKITLLTILAFIIVNIADYVKFGNEGNCGCMGMEISFTPIQSILKNIALFILTWIGLKYTTVQLGIRNTLMKYLLIFAPFILVVALRPLYMPLDAQMPMKGQKKDFTVMDNHPGFKGKTFTDNLEEGKKIVAFLSLTCGHCKIAAFKLTSYKAAHPELPIYFILNGDSVNMKPFMQTAGGQNIPKAHFNGKDDYATLSGYALPSILLLNNGVVEEQYNNGSLNGPALVDWYERKK